MEGDLPGLPCLCATARRTARVFTQLYDSYLRDSGIESSQYALLSVLSEQAGRSQSVIAEMLAFDKTTLSRNLKLLERKGWIAPAANSDRRQRAFVVTRAGLKRLKTAAPRWQKAQQHVHSHLSPREWKAAWKTLATLADAARLRKDRGQLG